ncbi:hypothetical protein SETIT_7G299600v2 [Setaria italica]|uniref:Uncharacterized protein n=1 Tax=Setaria italica TaxID=4555 RepID=A0A368S159_SETIT|nr:hypothetical protein SETIT_7G299600v2 [Setaria italica]
MTELIGSREHGIKRLEDFKSEKARQEAKSRRMADGQGVPGYRGEPSSLHQPARRRLGAPGRSLHPHRTTKPRSLSF